VPILFEALSSIPEGAHTFKLNSNPFSAGLRGPLGYRELCQAGEAGGTLLG
jgi:hypothetical protein